MRIVKDEKYRDALAGTIAGDMKSINQLIEMISPTILYVTCAITKNYHDGEDAAQETLIRIIQNIHSLSSPEAFETWMYRITINTAIKLYKKTQRHIPLDRISIEDSTVPAEETSHEFLPPEYTEDKEKQNLVKMVVNELPLHQRLCVLMFYYGDLSQNQIADAMHTNEKYVQNTLYQARKKIKEALGNSPSASDLYGVLPLPILADIFGKTLPNTLDPAAVQRVITGAQSKITDLRAAQPQRKPPIKKFLVQAVAGIAVVAVALLIGATVLIRNNAIKKNISPIVSESVTPDDPPYPAPTNNDEDAIRVLEDLIGEAHANELYSYVQNGVSVEEWDAFLNEIGATPKHTISHTNFIYLVYQMQKQNKQLIIIDRTDGQGIMEVAFRFCDVSEPIPEDVDVYFDFYEWRAGNQ